MLFLYLQEFCCLEKGTVGKNKEVSQITTSLKLNQFSFYRSLAMFILFTIINKEYL